VGVDRADEENGRAWRRADRAGEGEAVVHLDALLGLVTLAVAMITDNPLRYVHVLLPIGITIGCSLGLASTARTKASATASPAGTQDVGGSSP
jgi:hypothetical protein